MLKLFLKISSVIAHPFTKTLVYANVFISICALAQVFVTHLIFHIPNDFKNNSYLVFILLSTFLQYNMQRGYMMNVQNDQSERSIWLIEHKKKLLIAVGISLVVILFLCNELSWTSIGIMVGAELLSTLYYLPPFNLRKHGYIKPFLISLVWVVSCCLVPLIENNIFNLHSIWFIASQFIFISMLCFLFDIKDMDYDKMNGVNTYANTFGVSITKIISLFGLGLYLTCLFVFQLPLSILITACLFGLLGVIIILITNPKQHPFYYYFWVDGLLIAQAISFIIASNF